MNRLAGSTSPYLRQHADNPVDWWPWIPEAFADAKRRNVPIHLSIGYAACHWCHVMARESFSDPATAEVLNENFVSIKVDREERPEVDQIYMRALHALGEQGGWPLTMFLTPDAEPFWGGTYFPPEPRWGRPSFRQILGAVVSAWTARRRSRDQERRGAPRAPEPAGRATVGRSRCRPSSTRRRTRSCPSGTASAAAFKVPRNSQTRSCWMSSGAAYRRNGDTAGPRRRAADAHLPLPGRHLRSCRRRLRPLLGRCPMARPALRKDALRQRPASLAAVLRLPGDRPPLFRARIDETVELALREMQLPGRRLCLEPRRRHRARGGADLRLVLGRAAGGARRGFRAFRADLRRDARAEIWRAANILNRLDADRARMAGRRRGARPRRAAGQAAQPAKPAAAARSGRQGVG